MFDTLGLNRQLLDAVAEMGFSVPTPIQQQAIPVIRSGQHLIGIAQTGTGKTAAYLLPILYQLKYAQEQAPRGLILVPTKELVTQVAEQARALAKYTDLRIAALYGGVGANKQAKAEFGQGCDLVIATPGRLAEMYEKEGLILKKIRILVLDEADRMLDMGFLPQINHILDVLPRKKQNLLFSATFSPEVEELSWNFMDFPHKIEIAQEATPVETVEHSYYEVPNKLSKLRLLAYLLRDAEVYNRVLVFAKTKEVATMIFDYLEAHCKGPKRVIHSNKSQNARLNVFQQFREGELRIVVSTDVMARGVDVPQVSHVINFDVPTVYEDYVHRIGRTGRAWCTGSAVTFVHQADMYHLKQIEKKIRMSIPQLPYPADLPLTETPFEEEQEQLREIDHQKRKEDPNFKGAFHEKKDYKVKAKAKAGKRKTFSSNVKSFSLVSPTKARPKTSKHQRHKKK